jgi:biofilm PGA synthesis N-glycosyltransferase PgaC
MTLIICITILFYTYIGYGLVMWVWGNIPNRREKNSLNILPEVTVLIAAYNEELCIRQKIENTFQLAYPTDKLKVWVVADGSNDQTVVLAKQFENVKVFHLDERRGKVHAINRIMSSVESPITVLTDANAMLNKEALMELVQQFKNNKIAAVSGEKKVMTESEEDAVSAGEGLYWKYESFLKNMDARVNSLVGAAGELIAIRTDLYEAVPEDIIIEDFYLTLSLCKKGYKVGYAPKAIAAEKSSSDIKEELKRKVRICAGGFQSIVRLVGLLNPFRYGMLSFQYVSHRVLRWTLAPLALLVLLINCALNFNTSVWYSIFFLAQVTFYMIALLGYLLQNKKFKLKGFFIPYYFTIMNLAAFLGLSKLIFSNNLAIWDKSNRKI